MWYIRRSKQNILFKHFDNSLLGRTKQAKGQHAASGPPVWHICHMKNVTYTFEFPLSCFATRPKVRFFRTDWIIGNDLGSNAFNIVLRKSGSDCPLGIQVINNSKKLAYFISLSKFIKLAYLTSSVLMVVISTWVKWSWI